MKIGDQISLVSGVILDHNGNQVPDGTILRFTLYHDGDSVPAQIVELQTSQGIARGTLLIDQSGEIIVEADSGSATTSDVLTFEIPPELITATPGPPTQTPTVPPTPTILPTSTSTATPQATSTPISTPAGTNINFGDWLLALIVVAAISGGNYWITSQKRGLRWGVRGALIPLIAGLFTYTYLAANLPGSTSLMKQMGTGGVLLIVFLGSIIGAGVVWLWQMMELRAIRSV